ncbi:MAG: peptide chain release factor N(5)-glutamine methyltransferase, partial [Abditibacteriota bacterium]|nr:peptide chain release factor N(5)-glutamine methyltransferase [Abditibacteriota bacterium]
MTLGEAAEYGAKELCGLKTPLADCEILLAFALSESRLFVKTHPERLLSQREEAAFREFVARRKNNCPIAYITGRKEFLGLELFAAPGALVPRPETELVAEEAARLLAGKKAPRVCDMGTGSGALAVGLGTLVAGCFVTACDVSAEALAVAEKNVKRFGLENRTELVLSDWFSALEGRRFDMIVSNPPYI